MIIKLSRVVLLPVFCLLAACNAPGGPGSVSDYDWRGDASASSSSDGPAAGSTPARCRPARASEQLAPRLAVVSAQAGVPRGPRKEQTVFVSDLFNLFRSHCGACHVEGNRGNFQVTALNFSAGMDRDKVVASMKSDDLAKVMPPPVAGGIAFSIRPAADPVRDLLSKLQAWFDQGKPSGVFEMADGTDKNATESVEQANRYLVSEDLASQLTNIGSCIPDQGIYGSVTEEMDQLDAMFASATALPESLADTDLTSLDSAVLAEHGVIGFVPTYPLWSDGSAKMRAVRVPRGQSIRFDKEAQRFDVPPNTRFYKTFLKKVMDVDGRERYRKIETRLIVARPDQQRPDGSYQVQALFGSYAWNDNETEAHLVQDPLRNGQPFKDRLLTYVTDEPKAVRVREDVRKNPGKDLAYALEYENPGLLRHYSIPGAQRCIECHMGSPSADFVLGFTPLQLKRRRPGEAGVPEDPGTDELSQLKRLIEYKVITGLESPAEVRGLEVPQGERKYRNPYELRAQAYLLGNCAHCHNPRGFPSVKEPLLRDVLDFLPSEKGGIFQFPLDRFSPIRRRGPDQDVPVPYITPSLYDRAVSDPIYNQSSALYVRKCEQCEALADHVWCEPYVETQCIEAPWRSLMYRNVDTPFIYTEDFTIFPHMPRNTAGFDCRAPRILGEWMVSIPSKRVTTTRPLRAEWDDTEPQNRLEVLPGDSDYSRAVMDTEIRLRAYQKGKRANFCPDSTDIVDPDVRRATQGADLVPKDKVVADPDRPGKWRMTIDGVPDKAHVVDSDLTDSPGDWQPRNGGWASALVNPKPQGGRIAEHPEFVDIPLILKDVTISDGLRTLARSSFPMGLWRVRPECDFSGVKKVGALDETPRWARDVKLTDPDAPVYEITHGQGVFNQICINCHGPKADSKGLLAEAISETTGGGSRVANFKDGILGPPSDPGANLSHVFGSVVTAGSLNAGAPTAEDWAARYFAFMALGGTQRLIPQGILNLVSSTKVLGEQRKGLRIVGNPNMLQVAREMCKKILGNKGGGFPVPLDSLIKDDGVDWTGVTGLITTNGDADLWTRICNEGNWPVVRVVKISGGDNPTAEINPEDSFYWATEEIVRELETDLRDRDLQRQRTMPVCLPGFQCAKGGDPCGACANPLDSSRCQFANELHGTKRIPWCPESLLVQDQAGKPRNLFKSRRDNDRLWLPDVEKWAARGAINAGLAAFIYLRDFTSGKITPTPAFDQCEKLKESTTSPP